MKNKLERVLLVVIYLIVIYLVFYSCWSFIKCHEYISTLVEQSQLRVEENGYEITNYYMVNAFIYIIYAALLSMGALLYCRIGRIKSISFTEVKQAELEQFSLEKTENCRYDDQHGSANNNALVSESDFEKEDYFNSRRMKIEPFNMATFAIEVYERIEPQLKAKGHKLEILPDDAFDTDIIIDSEMSIRAVCAVFCWGSSLLLEASAMDIIAADNIILLKLPISGGDLNEQYQNLLNGQMQRRRSDVYNAVEFIQNIRGNVTIVSAEEGMIKITLPAYKKVTAAN